MNKIPFEEFKPLYDACTPEQRQELMFVMLAMKEKRRREKLKLLVSSPRQLESLPVSELREIASTGIDDAHAWLIENFPQSKDVLDAMECLTFFTLAADEPTPADLRDVVTSLEDVWKASGGNYLADLVETPAVGSKAKKPARSVATETKARKA
jgi:hypothetical protein